MVDSSLSDFREDGLAINFDPDGQPADDGRSGGPGSSNPELRLIPPEGLSFDDHSPSLLDYLQTKKEDLVEIYEDYNQRLEQSEEFYGREAVLCRYLECVNLSANNAIVEFMEATAEKASDEEIDLGLHKIKRQRYMAVNFLGIYPQMVLPTEDYFKIQINDHPSLPQPELSDIELGPAAGLKEKIIDRDLFKEIETEARKLVSSRRPPTGAEREQILQMINQEIVFRLLTLNFQELVAERDRVGQQIENYDRAIASLVADSQAGHKIDEFTHKKIVAIKTRAIFGDGPDQSTRVVSKDANRRVVSDDHQETQSTPTSTNEPLSAPKRPV